MKLSVYATCVTAVLSVAVVDSVDAEQNNDFYSSTKAISKSNWKAGGVTTNGNRLEGSSSATLQWARPIGNDYGLQLDALVGGTSNHGLLGATGQFINRNPESGYLGLYGSTNSGANFIKGDNRNLDGAGKPIGRLGLTGSKYLDNWTLGGVLGAERDYNARESGFFDRIGADYYATQNFRVGLFHQYTGKTHGGGLAFEYLFSPSSATPISFYGEAADAKDSVLSLTLGARVLFGATSNRSLQERDRHDYVYTIAPRALRKAPSKFVAALTTPAPAPTPAPTTCSPLPPDDNPIYLLCMPAPPSCWAGCL